MVKLKLKNGFTLIELLVVTGLVLVIIAVVVQLFFSALRGAAKTAITNETRQTGDYAMSVMERMIRNAQTIENITTYCDGTTQHDKIDIVNQDSQTTTFQCPLYFSTVYIASNSATGNSQLTSSKVAVEPHPDCNFICTKTGSGPAVVSIDFTIHQLPPAAGVTLRPEEKNSIDFQTSVVVRNTGL
ncbi:prepilin-type N-terminal cleavage/methylation domain-containing protein [Candidatus Gottesmanbacteria bacterium]|nr:prepilin-type N-terminal cleavage/methylation domain-containing protein [Candidatus Gottesmanbacteria bacterium]